MNLSAIPLSTIDAIARWFSVLWYVGLVGVSVAWAMLWVYIWEYREEKRKKEATAKRIKKQQEQWNFMLEQAELYRATQQEHIIKEWHEIFEQAVNG